MTSQDGFASRVAGEQTKSAQPQASALHAVCSSRTLRAPVGRLVLDKPSCQARLAVRSRRLFPEQPLAAPLSEGVHDEPMPCASSLAKEPIASNRVRSGSCRGMPQLLCAVFTAR